MVSAKPLLVQVASAAARRREGRRFMRGEVRGEREEGTVKE